MIKLMQHEDKLLAAISSKGDKLPISIDSFPKWNVQLLGNSRTDLESHLGLGIRTHYT